ncbi:MAG: helix-turn-helix domain-containing protein [Acidimicrobiales bacterium]
MAEEEWLDAEAAARHLGLPTGFIYAMVNADQLPALRFPVRIRRHDLAGCLERCKIKPGDLAHLDPNGDRRGGNRKAPLTSRGTPDRRFGRRNDLGTKDSPGAR